MEKLCLSDKRNCRIRLSFRLKRFLTSRTLRRLTRPSHRKSHSYESGNQITHQTIWDEGISFLLLLLHVLNDEQMGLKVVADITYNEFIEKMQ